MKHENLYSLIKKLDSSWQDLMQDFVTTDTFEQINKLVIKAYKENICYPKFNQIFHCFEILPVSEIKVIIIGQDPYHQEGQAHGLAFSVPENTKIPRSLDNIYKELVLNGLINKKPNSGNLKHWAEQGVLLLNSGLTVEANKANSHKFIPWKTFTDYCIGRLAMEEHFKIFALWGTAAKKKEKLINGKQNLILKANHPSPLSANRGGWFNSNHFIKINTALKTNYNKEINWHK